MSLRPRVALWKLDERHPNRFSSSTRAASTMASASMSRSAFEPAHQTRRAWAIRRTTRSPCPGSRRTRRWRRAESGHAPAAHAPPCRLILPSTTRMTSNGDRVQSLLKRRDDDAETLAFDERCCPIGRDDEDRSGFGRHLSPRGPPRAQCRARTSGWNRISFTRSTEPLVTAWAVATWAGIVVKEDCDGPEAPRLRLGAAPSDDLLDCHRVDDEHNISARPRLAIAIAALRRWLRRSRGRTWSR